MIEVGRVCIKTAGKDAGKHVVVIDVDKDNFVIIDGGVKRKRCNPRHLEPTAKIIPVKKGDDSSKVRKAFAAEGIEIKEKKGKAVKEKQVKKRVLKSLEKSEKKSDKKKPAKK